MWPTIESCCQTSLLIDCEIEVLGTPGGNLRNQLAVQQLFAEVKGKALGLDVGVRAGRQEFFDGPQLLTVGRDNNTLYFVLDGVPHAQMCTA